MPAAGEVFVIPRCTDIAMLRSMIDSSLCQAFESTVLDALDADCFLEEQSLRGTTLFVGTA
jgi:hypothetical protein